LTASWQSTVDCVLRCRLAGRPRYLGALETALTVHVCSDVALSHKRTPSAGGNRNILTTQVIHNMQIAFVVVFSTVWFPETVVTPSNSTSGLVSASISATAPS
jgi:hypothetical protein